VKIVPGEGLPSIHYCRPMSEHPRRARCYRWSAFRISDVTVSMVHPYSVVEMLDAVGWSARQLLPCSVQSRPSHWSCREIVATIWLLESSKPTSQPLITVPRPSRKFERKLRCSKNSNPGRRLRRAGMVSCRIEDHEARRDLDARVVRCESLGRIDRQTDLVGSRFDDCASARI